MSSRVVRQTVRWGATLAVVGTVAALLSYALWYAPVAVGLAEVRRGLVQAEVLGTGTLEARTRATISPKIAGRLARVMVDQGDRVRAGQELATLDDGDLRQQVEVAKAERDAAAAAVARSAAEVARAEARRRQAYRQYERVAQVHEAGAATQDEFDKATEDRDIADAELDRANLMKVEAQRQVQRAEQSLRYYEERLADTRIVAPFDGLIVRRVRDPGDVLVPGGAIAELISTEQLWVSAWVDETAVAALAEGQRSRVVFRSEPEEAYPGSVARVAPQADRETRELIVDVAVDRLPHAWAVGQRAEAYIETAKREDAVTVPQRAVVWRGSEAGVVVNEGGTARWQAVSLGLRGREDVEVTAGLVAGQVVALVPPGQEPPRDGRRLQAR